MGKIIDAIKDARARQVNDTARRVAPSMANKDIAKTTSNQRDRENSQRYNYAERAELRKSEQASQTTPQQNNAAAQERGRKQTEYAKQSPAAREKEAARLKANRYTQEANDLDNEGRAKADVYVDGIYMGTDQEVLNEYGRQANAKRELAAQQQAIADRIDTDDQRDGLLSMYKTALENENSHMDFSDGTDKAAKEAYAEATRQREHIEDLIKDKNRELGNDTYAGIDELGRQYLSGARTRDAAQRLEGGRVANYQALAGTAAEWLDDKRQKLDLL